MVSLNLTVAIGAAATVPNALVGQAIEYWGRAGVLTLYGNADIVGMSHSLTLYSGADPGMSLIPAGSQLHLASTVGNVKVNEDFIGQFPVPMGSRLVHAVVNPGAGSNARFNYVAS